MTIPSRSNVKGDNDNQVRGIKNFLAFQYKRIFKKWLTTLTKEILLLFEYKFEHKIDYHNYPLFQDLKFEAGDVFIFFLIWAPMFLYTLFLFKKRVHMYVTCFCDRHCTMTLWQKRHGQTDGSTLLQRCEDAAKNVFRHIGVSLLLIAIR